MANTKISSNGGYSWWTHPLFIQAPSNRYFTAITSAKKWRVFQNDSGTYTDLNTCPELDDHNAPSVVVVPNKSKKAYYTRHAKSTIVNKAKASSGISFVDDSNINFPENCTYSQALYYDDKIRVFTRSGFQTWRYARTNDWGANWLDTKRFLDFSNSTGQIYMTTSPSSTTGLYHLAVYGHPVNSDFTKIVYGTIDVNTGDVTDGNSAIADLDDVSGLPLGETDLDVVIDYSSGTERCRLFDVGESHGKAVVLYAKWDDTNSIDPRYYLAYKDSSNVWQHIDTGIDSGDPFWSPSRYLGGMSIDKSGNNKFYLSYKNSGTWYIDEITINSDMTLGNTTNIALDSEKPLVRPYAVYGGNYAVWQRLVTYNAYNDYSNMEYWTNG